MYLVIKINHNKGENKMTAIKVNFTGKKRINTMAIAHELWKKAAIKWNCKKTEILFDICLKMAHAGQDIKILTEKAKKRISEFKAICTQAVLNVIENTTSCATGLGDLKDSIKIYMECHDKKIKQEDNVDIEKYTNQYGNKMVETVINGTSYDIEIFENDTKEDIEENFFFEFGESEESRKAFKLLINA